MNRPSQPVCVIPENIRPNRVSVWGTLQGKKFIRSPLYPFLQTPTNKAPIKNVRHRRFSAMLVRTSDPHMSNRGDA